MTKIKKYNFYYRTEINLNNEHSDIFKLSDFFEDMPYVIFNSCDFSSDVECMEEIDKNLLDYLEKIEDNSDALLCILSEYNEIYYPDNESSIDKNEFDDDEMSRFILFDEKNEEEICIITVKVQRASSYYNYNARTVH